MSAVDPCRIRFLLDDKGLRPVVCRVLNKLSEGDREWVIEKVMFVRHAYGLRMYKTLKIDKGPACAFWAYHQATDNPETYQQRFISLSDALATACQPTDFVDAVIAHEICHWVLREKPRDRGCIDNEEAAADEYAYGLGFGAIHDARKLKRTDWGPAIQYPPWPDDQLPSEAELWRADERNL